MELYQTVLDHLDSLMKSFPKRKAFPWDENQCWPETERFELVMGRDAAYELGSSQKGAANYTCVTTGNGFWEHSGTIVIGPDLNEITTDTSYARLVILNLASDLLGDTSSHQGSGQAFRILQKLDFIKYHVFAKGFMIRTSSENFREQVRVSKEALRQGITFEKVGNAFLRHYLEVDGVKAATIVFLTDPSVDYKALLADAKKAHEIMLTLSRILEGMPTDCSMCHFKPVCDEVDGMRELHFGKQVNRSSIKTSSRAKTNNAETGEQDG